MRASERPPSQSQADAAAQFSGGKVLETMDASSYTYVRVQTSKGEVWVAGPSTPVKVGDAVHWVGGTEMKNFPSKTLGRTFESILFVGQLMTGSAPAATAASPHANIGASHNAGDGKAESADVKAVAKADGGMTIAEIYDRRADVDGKQVTVRGKVVKYNAGVMGRNWIHLQDGSVGAGAENDLTATTSSEAAVGDVVTVRGKVARDRDFGFGYKYSVMLEDASIERK
jgi:hypothetical protein